MTDRKLKTIFLFLGIFPGKADSVILLGFECTINPQNLIKIVEAIFEKIKMFNFFSCELPLILGVLGKLKKTARDMYKRNLDIEFERDQLIGFCATLGDCHIDSLTHPQRERERDRLTDRQRQAGIFNLFLTQE